MLATASNRTRAPKAVHWSQIADQRLSRLRHEGESMRSIARAFGLSRTSVTERARQLGLDIPARSAAIAKPAEAQPDPQREPMPAGHPVSWGLLIEGTCLEGSPYTPPLSPLIRAATRDGGRAL
jgi:hypothetical protein